MSANEVLAAYEDHLITETEAVEQAAVDSIDELSEVVEPEYYVATTPARHGLPGA